MHGAGALGTGQILPGAGWEQAESTEPAGAEGWDPTTGEEELLKGLGRSPGRQEEERCPAPC